MRCTWCRRAGLYRNLGRNDREDDHGEEAEEVEDEDEERRSGPPRRARRRRSGSEEEAAKTAAKKAKPGREEEGCDEAGSGTAPKAEAAAAAPARRRRSAPSPRRGPRRQPMRAAIGQPAVARRTRHRTATRASRRRWLATTTDRLAPRRCGGRSVAVVASGARHRDAAAAPVDRRTMRDCIARSAAANSMAAIRNGWLRAEGLPSTDTAEVRYAATYNILIMGASYGSLLASKLLFGGHSIHLVCLPAEADLINAEGFRVRLPVTGRKDPVELEFAQAPRQGDGRSRRRRRPEDYDLVGLCDAGAAIPLARRARTARRGGEVARALHVDHEHAAAALREAHPRPRLRGAEARLYRPDRLGHRSIRRR